MPDRHRLGFEAWIPIAAGLFWLWSAPGHGFVGFLFSVIPGSLLLSSGFAMALLPGDLRISQFAALGGVLGVVLALPAFFVVGLGHGLLLVAASAAGFLAAGHHTVRLEPEVDDVPAPIPSFGLAAQVAIDEVVLSTMSLSAPSRSAESIARTVREVEAAQGLFEAQGWLEKPALFHRAPPALEDPAFAPRSLRGLDYEHLSFESGYEPHEGEPGRDRWLDYAPNRTAHAWVVRHRGEPRPWLVAIHGYQMGRPSIDLPAFRAESMHRRLGLNLLLPVLPLHGPRAIGRRSGDGYLAGDVLDTVHAQTQAMWDMRRLLSWIRAEGGAPVGVYGLSLGGYNTAMLSCLDEGLACAVAGIPATDFTRLFYRHGAPLALREAERAGIDEAAMDEVFRVVSPLTMPCQVPAEHRAIFGGVADRLVPPDQVRDLWEHWEHPRITWYQGSHLTFARHPEVGRMLDETLRGAGLVGSH